MRATGAVVLFAMSNSSKGIVVALATLAVVTVQLAMIEDSQFVNLNWMSQTVMLLFVAVPCGAFAGSLAGRLRDDRFLQIAGFGLAVPACLGFLTMMIDHRPLSQVASVLLATAVVPILIATAALERWTRPPAEIPVAMPERRPAWPTWRRPSAIELSVGLTMLASAALALMIALGDRTPLHEYSYWYKRPSAVDLDQPHYVFVFLAGLTFPIAVVLGRIASTVTSGRLLSLISIAGLGAAWIGSLVGVFTPLELHASYLLPPVVVVVILERFSRPTERQPLGAVGIGAWLGAANAIAVSSAAFVLVLRSASRWDWEMMSIPCIALVFSVPAGAVLGAIANRVRANRLFVLELIALSGVCFLALVLELPVGREPSAMAIFLWACCTTAVGVFILERATRVRNGSDPHGAGTREALRHPESAGRGVVRS